MSLKNNARLVYSTADSGKCPVCGWPQRNCQCSTRRAASEAVPTRVVAKLRMEKKGRGGISVFLVERETPGFKVGRANVGMVGGGTQVELLFEDCRVPAANMLGAEGWAFASAMRFLGAGRHVLLLGGGDDLVPLLAGQAEIDGRREPDISPAEPFHRRQPVRRVD